MGKRKSEDLLQIMFENSGDAILWADVDTCIIINCNRSAEKMLGRPKKDIIGMHQTEIHPAGKKDYYSR
ncbi:PAS domain S-box protein, partial [Candidatus Auribacterota bacterium]